MAQDGLSWCTSRRKKMFMGLGRVGMCVTTDLWKPEDNSVAVALLLHLYAGSGIKPKSGLTRNKKCHPAGPTYRGWEGCKFSSCWVVLQILGQSCWLQALFSSGFPSSWVGAGKSSVANVFLLLPDLSGSASHPAVLQLTPQTRRILGSSCWTDTHYFAASALPLITLLHRLLCLILMEPFLPLWLTLRRRTFFHPFAFNLACCVLIFEVSFSYKLWLDCYFIFLFFSARSLIQALYILNKCSAFELCPQL